MLRTRRVRGRASSLSRCAASHAAPPRHTAVDGRQQEHGLCDAGKVMTARRPDDGQGPTEVRPPAPWASSPRLSAHVASPSPARPLASPPRRAPHTQRQSRADSGNTAWRREWDDEGETTKRRARAVRVRCLFRSSSCWHQILPHSRSISHTDLIRSNSPPLSHRRRLQGRQRQRRPSVQVKRAERPASS